MSSCRLNKSILAPALFALLTIVALCGCKTVYRDPGLTTLSAPSAVLIHKRPAVSGFVVKSIDGNSRPVGLISRYELLPGRHSVVVAPNEGLATGGKIKIDFEAEPGHHYQVDVDAKFRGGYWWAWILDTSTGERFEGTALKD